ncbi:MAG: SAM-dependent methyltransferase [Clostridia bacterium]|nr:SAM-dependent methyltransferase [Clostridia bacterium]
MELTNRLKSVYSLLPEDCIMIDVGTDHCYLPIYAILNEKVKRAYAADVRQGPLQNGKENAAVYGCSERITALLSDGLQALSEAQQQDIDTVVCAGMGGTLIQNIIAAAPFLKNKNKTLILQPQKAIFELKEYLAAQGFEIQKEVLSKEGNKMYQCMLVRFSGKVHTPPNPFALLKSDVLFDEYAAREKRRMQRQKSGMEQGGIPDKERYHQVCKHLKELEEML